MASAPVVGILIQARVGSSRLPGKVLLPLPLGGPVTLFEQVLRRAQGARQAAAVVVALPEGAPNDPLAALATRAGVRVWRGSETDVLARFQGAAEACGFAHIVRLTADNPALDPQTVDAAIEAHLAHAADYTHTAGLPLGTNVEVISAAALAAAAREATDPAEREHVTPFVRRRPARFRLLTLPLVLPGALPSALPSALLSSPAPPPLRLTVDYPSDYALLHLLYTTLGPGFTLPAVAALVARHPWLATLNAANEQLAP